MELVIITGLSGAGKSHALKKLEDMHYYCVDNLPIALLSAFYTMAHERPTEKAAVCIDCRDGDAPSGLWDAVLKLRAQGAQVKLIFLDASDAVLIKRYSETRRVHPLSPRGLISQGIAKERALMGPIVECVDYYIDTSSLKPSELGHAIEDIVEEDDSAMVIVQSFGFKRGIPPESDIMFDVRFVPNPFWIESLRPYSGLDEPVKQYVLGFEEVRRFVSDLTGLIVRLLPSYQREGKNRLRVSIGCTGGRHRSVCVAEALVEALGKRSVPAVLLHRDIQNDLQGK